jgi:hypothetical protein
MHKNTGRSLSGIVVNYLKTLVLEDNDIEIEENISRLSIQLPENFDEFKELREYLKKINHFKAIKPPSILKSKKNSEKSGLSISIKIGFS